jgi:catechol 2,3-dioxygenase-like lactoylglutathione lyase family enzyme
MPLKASETSYYVRDLKQAISFYVDKLGGKLIREFDWGFALIDVTGKKDYIGLFNVAYAENELGQGEVYPRPRLVLQADD